MQLISAILFVVSASLDNVIVGIAYGIKNLKISFSKNIIIALISSIGTFLSMLLGHFICLIIPNNYSKFIGSSVFIVLGMWCIIQPFLKRNTNSTETNSYKTLNEGNLMSYEDVMENPEKADIDNSGNIDLKECFILSFALAINNIGLGIGAGIAGINIELTVLLTLFFSLTAIPLGYYIGNKLLSKALGKYSFIISGLIIIILGIYETLF